jgi:hypothetical protein
MEGLSLSKDRSDEGMGHFRPFLYFIWCPYHHVFGWEKANKRP